MKKDLKGMKYLCMFVLGFCLGMWAAPAYADNDISIDAVSNPDLDNLDLTITQIGWDNVIDLSINHDDNTIEFLQTGHNNEISWVDYWGSGKNWGGDLDAIDTDLKVYQNCTKSAGNCNKNDVGFHIIDEDNTLWWGQGYYFSDRNDTTWTKDSSEGGGHIAYLDIHGDRNSIKGYQRNCSAGQCDGHRSDIWIYGDDNDVFAIQDTDGAKDLDIRIYNDDNTVDTTQTGYAEHAANITLNGSQPTTLTLIQQGNSARSYTLSQNCVTSGGCTITVTQD